MKDVRCVWMALAVAVGVTALAVAADSGEANLAANASFETPMAKATTNSNDFENLPENWEVFSSHQLAGALGRDVARSGEQSVRIHAQGKRGGNGGIYQQIDVEGDREYTFTADLLNDNMDPIKGSAYGELSIEWQDADGMELDRVRSKPWGPALSSTQWEKFEVKARAPSNAKAARVVVTLFDGPNASKGGFWMDNISVEAQ